MRPGLVLWWRSTIWGFPAPDVVLAVVACVVAVASVLTGHPDEGPIVITLPVAMAMTLALAWIHRTPWLAVTIIAVASLVQTLLAQPVGSLWSLAVYAIAIYSLAAWSSEGVAAIAGAGFVAALLVEERLHNGVDYVFIVLMFGGIWLLGRASNYWRGRVSAAEQRERQAARLAKAEERLRIARDLHDVVAHSLGAIAVQADAADAALHTQPALAEAPVRAIRETARGALTDIRHVLDVLRSDDDAGSTVAWGVAGIDTLVTAARVTGMLVSMDWEVSGAKLPRVVETACYRIVQESLTNARRHAPGAPTRVSVREGPNKLTIEVVSAAGESTTMGSGYGIRGMRERVRELGGTFAAGPTAGGGFAVRAALPLVPAEPGSMR